jgi:hypothetical protein
VTRAIAVTLDGVPAREFRHSGWPTFWNGLGVSDDEQGVQVFVVTGRRSAWARDWPAFRNYG